MLAEFELWSVVWRSIYVSIIGALLGSLFALPIAYILSLKNFYGRAFVVAFFQALMAVPPVVMGLALYILFKPNSIFGSANWLYGIEIMILAQALLVLPIVVSLTYSEFSQIHQKFSALFSQFPQKTTIETRIKFGEARIAITVAMLVGFGRALGEVGAVLIVGGNLQGRTELMTTAIVEEISKGRLDRALELGLLLLICAIFISAFALWFQKKIGLGRS